MNQHDQFTEQGKYTMHLQEHTPLSEQQAKILALRKMGNTTEEISDQLGAHPEVVETIWNDVLEQWNLAQNLCGIMGPDSRRDGENRKKNVFDDSPWRLKTSGGMSYSDEDRSRVELELYEWGTIPGYKFLLIEREISDPTYDSMETTEIRSVHSQDGLHAYIYNDADTLDEVYLRVALLHEAGIDPDSKYAPLMRDLIGREITETEREEALALWLSRVTKHWSGDIHIGTEISSS